MPQSSVLCLLSPQPLVLLKQGAHIPQPSALSWARHALRRKSPENARESWWMVFDFWVGCSGERRSPCALSTVHLTHSRKHVGAAARGGAGRRAQAAIRDRQYGWFPRAWRGLLCFCPDDSPRSLFQVSHNKKF